MRITSLIIGIFLAVSLVAFSGSKVLAQDAKPIKIGFVSVAKVLEQCNDGKKLKAELDKIKDDQTRQMKELKNQVETLESEIKNKGMVWDEYTRQLKQKEYYSLGQTIEIEKRRMEREFAVKRDELLPPFENKVGKVLEKIGKEGGYTVILDTSPLSPALPLNNILYTEETLDITDKVIQALNAS